MWLLSIPFYDENLENDSECFSESVLKVAYSVGFSDVSYFRKCFKDKYGMSASEYKKSH